MYEDIRNQVISAARELVERAGLKSHDIFVLGASTSEVLGENIGKGSSQELGEVIIEALLSVLSEKDIYLAVQGCEHINRALVVPRSCLEEYGLEEVTVMPQLHAGGACSVAYYKALGEDALMAEHIVAKAGLDIGDTAIGMHVKFVQIPVRLKIKEIGKAHLTALRSRPKLVGGIRAAYPQVKEENRG